jgi:hypothetical protein
MGDRHYAGHALDLIWNGSSFVLQQKRTAEGGQRLCPRCEFTLSTRLACYDSGARRVANGPHGRDRRL